MNSLPFARPGTFYRGNLHTHSNLSDGLLSPADVVAAYRDHGYDFLAITDHFLPEHGYRVTDTRPFTSSGFTALVGAELHAPATALGELWHILAVGLPVDFEPLAADETGPELAARAAAAGAFVILAHPAWYGLTLADALSIESAHAVEIYNQTCAYLNDRPDSLHLTEMLLAHGRRLTLCAADDAHFDSRPDWRTAWVHVKAESLEPDALLKALKAGHYYSSQGPQIHDLRIEGGQLRVTCSPSRAVFLSGRGASSQVRLGDGLTEIELSPTPFEGDYCRLTIVDEKGRRAWSNPIWLDPAP